MNRNPVSFHSLNVAQALGALNDNVLKLLIVLSLTGSGESGEPGRIAAIGGFLFVLPFLLFSPAAGFIADRFPKGLTLRAIKMVEMAVAATAVAAFFAGNQTVLFAVVFLMGTHTAFFAPAKYGILPELVPFERLSAANSAVEASSFLAIIAGTALAPCLSQATGGRFGIAAIATVAIAAAGLAATFGIPVSQPKPKQSSGFVAALREIPKDRDLFLAVLGTAWFMFVGAFVQIEMLPYGITTLGLTREGSGYLFLAAAVGIGSGSLLAGKLSGRNIEFGIVPAGAAFMAAGAFGLATAPSSTAAAAGFLILLGLGAGLFIIPLQSFIQWHSPAHSRGEILAASTFIGWFGVLLASGSVYCLSAAGVSPAQAFLLVGLFTLILALTSIIILPDFLLRFIALVAVRCVYRIRVSGIENVPTDGPALLIPNHVTWVDALLLVATQQRRIRFVMEREIYEQRFLNPLFRLMGVIPVSSRDGRRGLMDFIRRSRQALDEGYLVCIFAEGHITRNGVLQEFRGGFEHIVKGSTHPIIPIWIGGAWGSILSYAHGAIGARLPLMLPYPVSLIFGKQMPPTSTPFAVRQQVMELSAQSFEERKPERLPLHEAFVRTARQHWKLPCIADTSGKRLTYGETAIAAAVLAKRLAPAEDEKMIGLLLPPSAGGALANLAVLTAGRIPVNLNYTASPEGFASAIRQCGLKRVISSAAFLEKIPLQPEGVPIVPMEDLAATIAASEKLTGFIRARLIPARLSRPKGFTPDDCATVIFSSGSTGEPKGVMLSHHNIMSNLEGLRTVFRPTTTDNICSALPFFHSLGFTGTLWLPLLSGFSAVYHPNPLDGGAIADAARQNRSTLLLATPTFLMTYLRKAKPDDFATLRMVITGAEKLNPALADSFEKRFGIRPMEGYGATELSPVATLSVADVELQGVRSRGNKEGSVGHPLPGVVLKIVDPETGEALQPGKPGLLLVKGPNVMTGYLGRPDKTAEAIRDGWYVTGDIAILDDDGFLRITDRLARFSKIGGEMVPHGAVEDALHDALGQQGVVAVTSVPDERKGERLAVVYREDGVDVETLQRLVAGSSLPNLWKPARDAYIGVTELPLLGTGKLDLQALKRVAAERLAA